MQKMRGLRNKYRNHIQAAPLAETESLKLAKSPLALRCIPKVKQDLSKAVETTFRSLTKQ